MSNIDEKTETGVPEENVIEDKVIVEIPEDKVIPDEIIEAIKTTDGVVIDDGKIKDIETLTQEAVQDGKKQMEKKKKELVLPEIGAKFLLAGESYKVCYVNKGQKRFSAEPCDGHY